MVSKSKAFFSILLLGSINCASAEEFGIWADGLVTYRHPNGDLVNRDCKLFVPAMGQGQVTLSCGTSFTVSSSDFDTKKENGKTTFTVIFKNVPGAPEGTVARYSGAYLRGNNRAIYYGDVFAGVETNENSAEQNSDWNYVGGFMFSKDIEQ